MNLNFCHSAPAGSTSSPVTKDDGTVVAHGWAGNHDGKLNHAMQEVHNVGPLPVGVYRIGRWQDTDHLGPMAAPLLQIEGETFGRSGFWIHGAAKDPKKYGQESKGCLVIEHEEREAVRDLTNRDSFRTPEDHDTLTVTA